jgi:hypothetical protein
MPSSRRSADSGSSRDNCLTNDEEPPRKAGAERRPAGPQTMANARKRRRGAAGAVPSGALPHLGRPSARPQQGTGGGPPRVLRAPKDLETTDRKDCPPTFELEVRARAREVTFRVIGDVTWRTEGTGHVERTGRRDGLPFPALPHVWYTDVHVSTHIKAWLNETAQPSGQPPPGSNVGGKPAGTNADGGDPAGPE